MKIHLLISVFSAAAMMAGAQENHQAAHVAQRAGAQVTQQIGAQVAQQVIAGAGAQGLEPMSALYKNQLSQYRAGERELVQVYDTLYNWDWNETGMVWDVESRHIDLQYDDDFMLIGSTQQIPFNGSWENYAMTSTVISDDGKTITTTQQMWINNAFVNLQRMITEYEQPDAHNTTVTIQNWTDGAWLNEYRWIWGYFEEGPLAYETDQLWLEDDWVNVTRFQYAYDDLWSEHPNLSETLISEWMDPNWVDVVRYSMLYDQDDLMVSRLEEFFDESTWVNSTKDTLFTYDSQMNNTGYNTYMWAGTDWMDMYRIEQTFDMHNNRTSYMVYQWMGSWSMVSKEVAHFTYDANDFVSGESSLNYQGSEPNPMSGDSTYYIYHTEVTGAGALPLSDATVTVWPNPVRGKLNISCSEPVQQMEVIDLSGRKMATLNTAGGQVVTFNTSELPAGLYLLRVVTEKGVYDRKVVKR